MVKGNGTENKGRRGSKVKWTVWPKTRKRERNGWSWMKIGMFLYNLDIEKVKF